MADQPLPGSAEGDGSVRFEPAMGRWGADVLFVAASSTGRLIIRRSGLEAVAPPPRATRALLKFRGSTGPLEASAERQLPGVTSYFAGRDPSHWYRNVPAYGGVRLAQVYPGVDVVLTGLEGELQIAVVAAHAQDLSAFRLGLDGHEFVASGDGQMVARLEGDVLRLGSLKAFSKQEAGWHEEQLTYGDGGALSFRQLGAASSLPLVVDPTLTWSVSMQGGGTDRATSVAAASDGGFYVAGWTYAQGFPGTSADTWTGGAFVSRFAADRSLLWTTILKGQDQWLVKATGVAVSGDDVWVTGQTYSPTFPVLHPYQASLAGGWDAFLVRLSSEGQLVYSSYLGGTGSDRATGLAVLANGSPVVGGATCSRDFPTTPGAMGSHVSEDAECDELVTRGSDGFVAVLTPDGQSLVWATYLGGKNDDAVTAVAATPAGEVVAAGWTWSPDFPLKYPLYAFLSGTGRDGDAPDGFLSRLGGATGTLLTSTFLGGRGYDEVDALAVEADGSIVAGGSTGSCDFPVTAGAYDTRCPVVAVTWDAGWVAVLSGDLWRMVAATFVGGTSEGGEGGVADQVSALALDGAGRIWAGGIAFATDFPAVNAFQPFMIGYHDATIQAFSPALDRLLFSTFLGGVEGPYDLPSEQVRGAAVLTSGQVVVAGGSAGSATFPRTAVFGVPDDTLRHEHAIVCTVDPDHGGADLQVTVSGPGSLLENQTGVFTATVANVGSSPALDPELLVDYLGWMSEFGSPDPAASCRQMEYLYGCKRATLAPGESFSSTFSYEPYWEAGEGLLVVAARSRVSEPTPKNVDVVLTPPVYSAADLGVRILDSPPDHPAPTPGEVFHYWISANNVGHKDAARAVLHHPLPAGGHFLSWSTTAGQCDLIATGLQCQFGTIKTQEGVSVEVYLELPRESPVELMATVETTSPEGNLTDNVAHDRVDLASDVAPFHAAVAAIAHNHGAAGTLWRSDLEVVNPYQTPTDLELDLVTSGGTVHRSVTLPAGNAWRWPDVEVTLFGVDPAAESSGAIHVRASRRVAVGARTYNTTASGTYGQFMPAIEEPTNPTSLQGTIPWLKRDADFRTNLGFLNLAGKACSGTLMVSDSAGKAVLHRPVTIPPLGWVQLFDILALADPAPALGMARLDAPSDCAVWTYASMVDARTGDPTTIGPFSFPGGSAYVAAVAHLPGVAGTIWRTDMALVRPASGSGDPTVTLQLIQPTGTTMTTVPVSSGPLTEWQNVGESIFSLAPSDQAAGAVMGFDTGGSLIARTYNRTPGGTYGQSFDSEQAWHDSLRPPQLGLLPFVEENDQVRTNVGFLTPQVESPATVRLTLFDGSGKQIGQPLIVDVGTWTVHDGTGKAVPVNGGPWLAINHVVTRFGVSSLDHGYIRVEISKGARVWAYASVIDQRTGDPMTVSVWPMSLYPGF